ncbi:hypothetical protein [Salarchaeum japonicum]|uniref:Uncharacterized protein n=1 Tax=Salarchaeum japonicum TaxID=555573 RepID=A0AAV3T1X5_9EURY|nr:hypothetical protein [Salarchaeum japonicum]
MADENAVHDMVVDLLSEWESPVADKRVFTRRLTTYLSEELADRGLDMAVERTAQGPCDIVVGDVGVLVFTDFSHADTIELRSQSDRIRERVETLVVFGYLLPERDLDRWRMGEFKYEAMGLRLDEVTFLRRDPKTETVEEHGWPSRVWRFAIAVVALLSIVIGIELAILYQAFGGVAPSPEFTLAAVVVLSALLVFIYERIPV